MGKHPENPRQKTPARPEWKKPQENPRQKMRTRPD